MEHSNKTLALAKFLDVDPALISNDYSQYFTVNQRVQKRGKTPEHYRKTIEDMKLILSEEDAKKVEYAIVHARTDEERDAIYKEVSLSLDPLAARAKHQLTVIPDILKNTPPRLRQEAAYLRLQQDNLYVVNVLYFLIKSPDNYNKYHQESLRDAFLGRPINDNRENETVYDGEYLVLTDEEADDWEEEGLRNLFDEMTNEVPDFIKKFVDEDKYVAEYSGNRGENINGYDGTESSQVIGSETFYIYRSN